MNGVFLKNGLGRSFRVWSRGLAGQGVDLRSRKRSQDEFIVGLAADPHIAVATVGMGVSLLAVAGAVPMEVQLINFGCLTTNWVLDRRDFSCERELKKPGRGLRATLDDLYAPDDFPGWCGEASAKEAVEAFVADRRKRDTLVFVDPKGLIKRRLLDNMYRGQRRVVAPTMKSPSLKKAIQEHFGISEDLDAGAIGRSMRETNEDDPVKVLLDLSLTEDPEKIKDALTYARYLKEAAGDAVATIAVVNDAKFIHELPKPLKTYLQVITGLYHN